MHENLEKYAKLLLLVIYFHPLTNNIMLGNLILKILGSTNKQKHP